MIEFPVIVGSAGVFLLLLAFFLNLFKIVGQDTKAFVIMNIAGGGLACYASILIGFLPFVILNGTWAMVAVVGLVRLIKK
ncbi:MAG: hypothetical protein KJ709_00770 [Nanoarchaeota archaeon]|nr:hypothetical protein [Nanoarchaeota archaeon]